jgi:hypothetical protein
VSIEAFTRERAFFSGVMDFAMSRDVLPDEVFIWVFQSGMSAILGNLANFLSLTNNSATGATR